MPAGAGSLRRYYLCQPAQLFCAINVILVIVVVYLIARGSLRQQPVPGSRVLPQAAATAECLAKGPLSNHSDSGESDRSAGIGQETSVDATPTVIPSLLEPTFKTRRIVGEATVNGEGAIYETLPLEVFDDRLASATEVVTATDLTAFDPPTQAGDLVSDNTSGELAAQEDPKIKVVITDTDLLAILAEHKRQEDLVLQDETALTTSIWTERKKISDWIAKARGSEIEGCTTAQRIREEQERRQSLPFYLRWLQSIILWQQSELRATLEAIRGERERGDGLPLHVRWFESFMLWRYPDLQTRNCITDSELQATLIKINEQLIDLRQEIELKAAHILTTQYQLDEFRVKTRETLHQLRLIEQQIYETQETRNKECSGELGATAAHISTSRGHTGESQIGVGVNVSLERVDSYPYRGLSRVDLDSFRGPFAWRVGPPLPPKTKRERRAEKKVEKKAKRRPIRR